jgi:hypothetical protein
MQARIEEPASARGIIVRALYTVIAAVFSFSVASCGSTTLIGYEGPPRPDDETVLIYGERSTGSRLAANIQIVSIDTPIGDVVPVNTRRVRLLPGEVCVGARATTSTMDQEEALMCFDANEGRSYEIRVRVQGVQRDLVDSTDTIRPAERGPFRITRFWIVDAGTSQVVAIFEPTALDTRDIAAN